MTLVQESDRIIKEYQEEIEKLIIFDNEFFSYWNDNKDTQQDYMIVSEEGKKQLFEILNRLVDEFSTR